MGGKNTQQAPAWNMWLKWQQWDGCFRSRQSVTPISTLKMVYSRRRSVTGLSVSGTWVEKIKLIVVGFLRINKASKRKKRNIKIQYSYLAHGSSQQHPTCSFMPACLRCRTLVDTKVLLYVLCCSVQGRLKAVLLCLRYVDSTAFGAWFVLLGVQNKKSRFKKKSFVVCAPWRPYC